MLLVVVLGVDIHPPNTIAFVTAPYVCQDTQLPVPSLSASAGSLRACPSVRTSFADGTVMSLCWSPWSHTVRLWLNCQAADSAVAAASFLVGGRRKPQWSSCVQGSLVSFHPGSQMCWGQAVGTWKLRAGLKQLRLILPMALV